MNQIEKTESNSKEKVVLGRKTVSNYIERAKKI